MTAKKHAVRVMIGGEEYTVRSDLSPEYTREVAAYLDQALKKVLSQGPLVETHKAAILSCSRPSRLNARWRRAWQPWPTTSPKCCRRRNARR